jgi:hypothetical protein
MFPKKYWSFITPESNNNSLSYVLWNELKIQNQEQNEKHDKHWFLGHSVKFLQN